MKLSVTTKLSDIVGGQNRLDANFYASAVFQAKATLEHAGKKGVPIRTIKDFSAGTYNPPPIKRIFTDDKRKGTPYMLPQEMFDFYWRPRKYVLADRMPKIADWYLKDGWVVLTQSGSVGKPYFASTADEKTVLSQNAIRIPPARERAGGYIYAYLSTWIGQTLLKKDEFGITVKHIRPQHVDKVPIPDLPARVQESIDGKIRKAFALRAEAIKLMNEAFEEVYDALGASHEPPTSDEDAELDEA